MPDQLPGNLDSVASPFTLSLTHHIFLRIIQGADEHGFFEIEATARNWSVKELKRQFGSSLYERLALSRDKKGIHALSKIGQVMEKTADMMKEPYALGKSRGTGCTTLSTW